MKFCIYTILLACCIPVALQAQVKKIKLPHNASRLSGATFYIDNVMDGRKTRTSVGDITLQGQKEQVALKGGTAKAIYHYLQYMLPAADAKTPVQITISDLAAHETITNTSDSLQVNVQLRFYRRGWDTVYELYTTASYISMPNNKGKRGYEEIIGAALAQCINSFIAANAINNVTLPAPTADDTLAILRNGPVTYFNKKNLSLNYENLEMLMAGNAPAAHQLQRAKHYYTLFVVLEAPLTISGVTFFVEYLRRGGDNGDFSGTGGHIEIISDIMFLGLLLIDGYLIHIATRQELKAVKIYNNTLMGRPPLYGLTRQHKKYKTGEHIKTEKGSYY